MGYQPTYLPYMATIFSKFEICPETLEQNSSFLDFYYKVYLKRYDFHQKLSYKVNCG